LSSPPVIADTGPLITLAGAGRLDLLPRLYGAVSIQRQALSECSDGAATADPDLETLAWLRVVDAIVLDPALPQGL